MDYVVTRVQECLVDVGVEDVLEGEDDVQTAIAIARDVDEWETVSTEAARV